jgi:hypothetical protein
MAQLFINAQIADLVLVVMLLEGVVLAVWHRLSGKGIAPLDLLPGLLGGVGLVLALRCAIVGAGWEWIAFSLGFALIGHVVDLMRRWRA